MSEPIKVGDAVIISIGAYDMQIAKVTRVTPTGRFNAAHWFFDKYGRQIGARSRWNAPCAKLATPHDIARVRNKNNRDRVKALKGDDLTDDQLARIVAILDEPKAEVKP